MSRSFSLSRIVCVFTLLMTLAVPAAAADFGDAPDGQPTGYPGLFAQDGQFPTLAASNGIQFTDLTQATLGPAVTDETDALITNGDSDDGIVNFIVLPISIPAPAIMTVNINGPATSNGGRFWVNVLIDINMNGEWDGVIGPGINEWAVKDFPVIVAPGVSQDIALPPFIFANGNRLPDGAWMRIALTDQPLGGQADWDGSGIFAAGEAEDHVIDLPRIAGPGGGPRKSCVPVMRCPNTVKLPANGAPRGFACAIFNLGSDDCTANYSMTRQTPGANARDIGALAPTCTVNGPAAIGPCGPTGAIGPAGMGLLVLAPRHVETFVGRKVGNLPSIWTYVATTADPDAVITAKGVTIGFQDSIGETLFVSDDISHKEPKEYPEYDEEQLKGVKDLETLKKLGFTMPTGVNMDKAQQEALQKLYAPENVKKYRGMDKQPIEKSRE